MQRLSGGGLRSYLGRSTARGAAKQANQKLAERLSSALLGAESYAKDNVCFYLPLRV